MKKKISKLLRKDKTQVQSPSRITNDTVAEHREKILAGGRRYKYPIQYAKHKLVLNAVLIVIAAVVVLIALLWWQLYLAHNTSTYMYRITQVLPLPVARIDGSMVRYSDYLLYERPSAYYLENFGDQKLSSEAGASELRYIKRAALDRAITTTYAKKIVKDKQITISDEEVQTALDSLRSASNGTLSEEAVSASAERSFGVSKADILMHYRNSITVSKASFAIDDNAKAIKAKVEAALTQSQDLAKMAEQINASQKDSVIHGASGLVSTSSITSGIRAADIAHLALNKVAAPVQSITDDGYFFIKLIEKNDTQVSYEFIQVPLKTLKNNIEQLRNAGKVDEYIKLQDK